MDFYSPVKRLLSKSIKAEAFGLSIPSNNKMGDVSSRIAFILASKNKKNPKEIADKLVKKLKPSGLIKEVKAVGPYINFYFDKNKIANKVINESLNLKRVKPKNKVINLDIYGPNMMKGLHLGHLRNAAIGACLYRLLKYSGFKVKVNSFGSDIGLPIAKVVWGYMNIGLKPDGVKGEWLGKLYAIAHNEFNNDPKVKQQVYDINKKIYDGDETIISAYNLLVSWSYDYIKSMADRLRLHVDKFINESDVVKSSYKIIDLLKSKGLAVESNGALIVNLEKYGLGVYVLLTSQGVPTYEAKDLALTFVKKKLFHPDEYVILTGAEQVMHFKQIIKTLELIGFKKGSIIHKPYELVLKDGKKLSSRSGTTLMISQLLDELTDAALIEVSRKNPSLSDDDKRLIANEVALSSLFYGMIKQDMNKTINFSINDWVKFDGDTGAYIQYSYVRALKLIKGYRLVKKPIVITDEAEYNLIKVLNQFNSVLNDSVIKLNASLIAHYAFNLAAVFSKFYERCPVVSNGVDNSRLLIVKAYIKILGSCMKILGMNPLSKM